MSDPERAARLWLAVAVATLWLLSVGGEADQRVSPSTLSNAQGAEVDLAALIAPTAGERRQRRATCARLVSVFRRGWVGVLMALLNKQALPVGRLVPEPWPTLPPAEALQRMPNQG